MNQEIPLAWRLQPLPNVLWIELTSRCPFDCIFCTRASLRGAGEHMDFELYARLIAQLDQPRIIRLNYAGESGHYPRLAEAVALAAGTGAQVEMVSALASLKPERLRAALDAGLNRLTVSLHTLDPERFREIYRFSSLERMQQRLQQVLDWMPHARHPFTLDLAFVAMWRNLDELDEVARLAEAQGIGVLAVHPVIQRDPLPMGKAGEHREEGGLSPDFVRALKQALERARHAAPSVALQVSSHELQPPPARLTSAAAPWPWPLPPGARIVGCDQSPFETVHVLANGDVVPCEVTEREAMGNLRQQTLAQIWHGERYRLFRQAHVHGSHPACNQCIYKRAAHPAPLQAELERGRAPETQLLRGWHPLDDAGTRWSAGTAAMVLARPAGARYLHLEGVLAPQRPGAGGYEVLLDGQRAHWQAQPGTGRTVLKLPLPPGDGPVLVELRCHGAASSAALGLGRDERELGFALIRARCA